jgi:predicted DNA binding CopG/RHH family protein
MKHIRWNKDKNEWLKKNRGVCFEQIVVLIEHDKILEIVDNPNQKTKKKSNLKPSFRAVKLRRNIKESSVKKTVLDSEEKEILESYENGEWMPIKNKAAEITKLRRYAKNKLQKNKRINIRLTENDMIGIKTKAAEEGIPYQTFIAGILHKYLNGMLTEKRGA